MRFIVFFAIFFYACCCFAALNIFFFDSNRQTSDIIFYRLERSLLNDKVRTEEIFNQCRNFTDSIVKHLNQRPTDDELQDILSQCSLILKQNSRLFVSKDENVSSRSQPFENHRSEEYNFSTDMRSTIESSKDVNAKNTGAEEVEFTSKEPKNQGNLKIVPTMMNPKPTAKNSGLWSLLFGNDDQYGGNSTGKPNDKPENQKTELNVIPDLTNKSWSLWNYVFGVSDLNKSSHEKPFLKNLEKSPTKESKIFFENSSDLKYLTTENPSVWNLIMPGTKWCGSGNIAENDEDLGYFEDVDRCCRAHDKCDDLMLPGVFKYNLTNTSPFTVLNCKCDDELYECLSQINSIAANTVGNTFFNILGRMCYMLDYPRICKKNSLLGCLEYGIDKTANKVYQWKPAKKYIKKPFNISS